MGIFIDYQSDDYHVKKILLSDDKWYELKPKTYFIKDAFEIGMYQESTQKYIMLTDMGMGFECTLKSGDILKGKLSEIKAFITRV